MAFRVLPNGVIETDTAAEAIQVARQLRNISVVGAEPKEFSAERRAEQLRRVREELERRRTGSASNPGATLSAPETFRALKHFLSSYTPHTKMLFELGRKKVLTIKEIREAYGLETNNEATGMIQGLRSMLIHRAGLDPFVLFTRDPEGPSRGDQSRYVASRVLSLAVSDTQMPEPVELQNAEDDADAGPDSAAEEGATKD